MFSSAHESSHPQDGWPQLSVVQRWFHAVVTHPEGIEAGAKSSDAQALVPLSRRELESMVTRSRNLTAAERLSIYANAYYARLIECLGEAFPALKHTCGEELFNGFSFGYLRKYPSRSYTLCRLGEHFAQFLDEMRPGQDGGERPAWADFLVDLATLEWTINEVFDGPGIEGRATPQLDALREIPAERRAHVRLRTAPCLRLLHTRYPLNEYYTAARRADDTQEIPIPQRGESYIAVTRRDFVVRRIDLSAAQYELLGALQRGRTLEEAVADAATNCTEEDDTFASQLQTWFAEWTQARLFDEVSLVEAPI